MQAALFRIIQICSVLLPLGLSTSNQASAFLIVTPEPDKVSQCEVVKESFGPKIVGIGKDVSSTTAKHPATAMLIYDSGAGASKAICSATLVAPNAVLTAAHCFCFVGTKTGSNRFFRNSRQCRRGKYSRLGKAIQALDPNYHKIFMPHAGFRHIKKVVIHRKFSWRRNYPRADLAIAILDEPVVDVRSVPLNEQRRIRPGTKLTAIGFGSRNTRKDDNKPVNLEKVVFDSGFRTSASVRTGRCRRLERYRSLICWDYNPDGSRSSLSSTCSGDSGGPLILEKDKKTYLAGVISAGANYRVCLPRSRAYNTEVFKFRKWIKRNLKVHAGYIARPAKTPDRKLETLHSCKCEQCEKKVRATINIQNEKTKIPPFIRYAVNCSGIKKQGDVEVEVVKLGKPLKHCSGKAGTAFECVDSSPKPGNSFLQLKAPKGSACNVTISTVR